MTQPAKVQEPSMEEILASIRRIIADDEAKPPVAEKAAAPAAPAKLEKPAAATPAGKPAAMNGIPPSAIPAAQAAAANKPAAVAPAPPAAKAAPAAAAPNSQDDIDALLSGLDEATSEHEIRPPQPEPEVFELTDEMALPDPAPAFQKIDPQEDLEFTEAGAAKPQPRRPAYEPPLFESAAPPPQILSRSTVSAVESAFNSLANTVLSNNARTLEDLVKEMLRPMLKSWLDDNLPGLVERIVKAEIERVSRGR
jgi:cell pole-organizing protein PopZ